MEYYRWVFRSMFRPDGWRMNHDMHELIGVPTLQLQGSLDTCVLPATTKGSGEYVAAPYTWRALPGVGHFPTRRRRTSSTPNCWAGWSERPADRDTAGRPLSARPRDGLGRPLPYGSPAALDELDPAALEADPQDLLAHAQQLLDAGRPFQAHEILEAGWKRAPQQERRLWRALAQLAVGRTHEARGNAPGATALYERSAQEFDAWDAHTAPHRIDVTGLAVAARALAKGQQLQRIQLLRELG